MTQRTYATIFLTLLSAAAYAAAPVEPERRNAVVLAVEKAGPAVVNISTERIVRQTIDPFFEFRDRFFDEMFRDFFGRHARTFVQNSLGSGVVISDDGYILTNAHVVMRATKIKVTFRDKKQFDAVLINTDSERDIALLKIESKEPLPVVPIGTSSDLMIGETTIAIGNPFGLENSVTTGVVSATDRSIRAGDREVFSGLLQTDAAINPGNSGGALLNIRGELIGINTAIQAAAEGIGFAIPVDAALQSACNLLDYRVLRRIHIGITTVAAAREVRIDAVEPGSPAAAAKLRPGDVILALDSKPVSGEFCFRRLVMEHKPGDTVVFRVQRGAATLDAKVTFGLVPEPSPTELAKEKLGLDVQDLTKDLAAALGIQEEAGVVIAGLEERGPGEEAGLRRSDVIVHFGGMRLRNVRALGMALKDIEPRTRIAIIIIRNRTLYRAVITSR